MKFTLDSVVFNSGRLEAIRDFYENKLGFPTGTYEKNGERTPDFSDSYVNYHVGGGLIGFERDEREEIALGDLVLRVSEFDAFKDKVRAAGIPFVKENRFFFMIKDPEGRTLIFEPS